MIDIKFLRENPDVVKQNIKNKFQEQTGIWHFWNIKIVVSIKNAYFFCQIFIFSCVSSRLVIYI